MRCWGVYLNDYFKAGLSQSKSTTCCETQGTGTGPALLGLVHIVRKGQEVEVGVGFRMLDEEGLQRVLKVLAEGVAYGLVLHDGDGQ